MVPSRSSCHLRSFGPAKLPDWERKIHLTHLFRFPEPPLTSLRNWQEVDALCGALQDHSISIDREFFGSLSAVLVPPSISLAIVFLEAVLASREGCRCLSLAIPQNGSIVQDVAALRVITRLSRLYLPDEAEVFPVLHQFMGVFPKTVWDSEQIIFLGALTAKLGRATKTVTKTIQEAAGIPDCTANIAGIRTAKSALAPLYDPLTISNSALEEEIHWIERETRELVDPILAQPDLISSIVSAFNDGRLDIPFPASREAKGAIIPVRDSSMAVRYARFGDLPFSQKVKSRNQQCLTVGSALNTSYQDVLKSVLIFAEGIPE